jgi:hypothetical protein
MVLGKVFGHYTPLKLIKCTNKFSEILEVGKFACSLSTKEFEADDWSIQTLKEIVTELRREIKNLSNQ